ncbi:MAG: carbohydrate-binding protein [Paludibacteraceae bacterium]|nr:carbohydrate-binding protein [Paludibacteraceae bacterium]
MKKTGLILMLLLCAVVGFSDPQTFYVSPMGNDLNDGTESMPFKTIAQAQKAVRAINADMDDDIIVYLREGTYALDNTITFTNADGGMNGHRVRYENYPNEHPLITGGMPIVGWELYDAEKNIWCAKDVTTRFRQLYVNGQKAIRARHPNLKSDGSHNMFRLTKVDTMGRAFDVASSYVSDWKNFDKVEIHLMIAWSDNVLRLEKKESYGNVTKLIPRDPERTRLFKRKYPMLGTAFMSNPPKQQSFYFENAYEFIDVPGEWYLDETTDVLYYKAREGESMAEATVVAPRINTLFSIEGSSTQDKVGYLTFKGLTFAHTNFLRPSQEGFLDLQAGMYNIDVIAEGGLLGSNKFLLWRPDAGFRVENAHHIIFEDNVFSQMAATGLDFVSGTNDDRVEGNVFMDLGGTGICVGKYSQDSLTEIHIPYNPTDKDEICTRDTLKNNLISHVTTEIQGAVGIGCGYPRDILIEHNEICYTNYSGISVGYGWTDRQTAMNHNRINWNYIHHVAQLLCDAGAIYTLSNQGYEGEIQHNYSKYISASEWADYWVCPIYLDEGTSGFNVSYNVAENAPDGIACNSCVNYTQNPDTKDASKLEETRRYAGIESKYSYIKEITAIPDVGFVDYFQQEPFIERLSIPGLIEAENYDKGGAGIAYSDQDAANTEAFYRNDGVDIVTVLPDMDESGGYAVGYTNAGEWMEYSVNVMYAGNYIVRAKVASGLENSGFTLLMDGKEIIEPFVIPQGEDWNSYSTMDAKTSALDEGEHVLRLKITGGYANIDWIQFGRTEGELSSSSIVSENLMGWLQKGDYYLYSMDGILRSVISLTEKTSLATLTQELKNSNLSLGVYIIQAKGGKIRQKISIQ